MDIVRDRSETATTGASDTRYGTQRQAATRVRITVSRAIQKGSRMRVCADLSTHERESERAYSEERKALDSRRARNVVVGCELGVRLSKLKRGNPANAGLPLPFLLSPLFLLFLLIIPGYVDTPHATPPVMHTPVLLISHRASLRGR